MYRHAFSLIELLIVISVIAILLGIVIAGVGHVRRQAVDVRCVSNLHSIGRAIAMYVEDNGGHLPGPLRGGQGDFTSSTQVNGTLAHFLTDYMGMATIEHSADLQQQHIQNLFICPSFSEAAYRGPPYLLATRIDKDRGAATDHDPSYNKDLEFPFGYPGRNSPSGTPDLYAPKTMHQILATNVPTSNLWAISDTDRLVPGGVENAGWKNDIPTTPIHNGSRNVLYFDWHVSKVTPAQ